MPCAVIFGGSGFIGSFFADFLISQAIVDKVYLVDIEPLQVKPSAFRCSLIDGRPDIEYVQGDVRRCIDLQIPDSVELIANFAAVHREPGHEDFEYYETNLLGAENVCAWAEKVGCNRLIFTSSISPYGPSEAVKDERSLPVPATAYGGSKLAAEKIHQTWQAKDNANRRLVIVRPGVVFGPGEGGNVSRLIKAVLHRYFFYMGNRSTRKAGVYVKELCNAMWWVLQQQEAKGEHVSLFNMSMNPGPSIEDYVETVCKVAGVKRTVPAVPYPLLLTAAYAIDAIAKPLRISHPFSPVRIRKLVRSNNILPTYLVENGYPYQYTLKSAFADWKQSCPEEWQ
ncbi:NAD-dependent epimerase/dehydratase family protein [Pseudomonas indica]|uniref:NAD-dependent epimerase/dehydratase family protein n=1 Tax=Pseudomonas indica TaxID=137658 RepID=UPI003FD11AA7